MRENRLYGSEGGVAGQPAIPTPIRLQVRKEEVRKALAQQHSVGVYGIGADPGGYQTRWEHAEASQQRLLVGSAQALRRARGRGGAGREELEGRRWEHPPV